MGALVAAGLLTLSVASAAPPSPPGDVQWVLRTETSAKFQWMPSPDPVHGYKIRPSEWPGVHPDPIGYPGGNSAAFTWTTDDGSVTNLVYDAIFYARQLRFSAFVNPGIVGSGGSRLAWDDVLTLHEHGQEIGNHTTAHVALIDNRALALTYLGLGTCTLRVTVEGLETEVDGIPDLDIDLLDPSVDYLVNLVALLEAETDYSATLLYSPLEIPATRSERLETVEFVMSGPGGADTLATEIGIADDAEMQWQVWSASATLDSVIATVDADYRCRTFAFPNHAHRQRAMTRLNEWGFRAARSGGIGERPFFSEASFVPGFVSTYEAPLNYPRPSNEWDEATTRVKYQERAAIWAANGTWAMLMAHNEDEADSAHVDWMIDEIANSGDIWIATFGEVTDYLNGFYVDVGVPEESGGFITGWIHDLDPAQEYHVVITAYNDLLEEGAWSAEVTVPAFVTGSPPLSYRRGTDLVVAPNPFHTSTTLRFVVPRAGPITLEVFDVRGARIGDQRLGPFEIGPTTVVWNARDASRRPYAAGVYFLRLSGVGWSTATRVSAVR